MKREPHAVAVPEIESELNEIWESLEAPQKTRAALFNLIVYGQDLDHLSYVQAGTRQILEKYPCRVIYLIEDRTAADDYLKVDVSVESMGTEACPVSCDKIKIEFSGQERERVPFILLPHVLPDLPIYLWWTGDPSQGEDLFSLIERQIGRIIFDPDSLAALPEYARFALDLMERFQGYASDLSWTLIDGWREAVAKTFADEEHLEQLKKAKSLTLTYTEKSGALCGDCRIPSLYLQAWIASQMGWQWKSAEGNSQIAYEGVSIQLVPDQRPLEPGSLTGLRMTSHEGYTYALQLEGQDSFVRIDRSSPTLCDLPFNVHVGKAARGRALVREIFGNGASIHYRSMLRQLLSCNWSNF
jgi:hypothetical protein